MLVARVAETCRATHNTTIAIAAAAAVAAAVSHGVEGGDWREAANWQSLPHGLARGRAAGLPDQTLRRASTGRARLVGAKPHRKQYRLIVDLVGTGVASQQSVPAAFAVLVVAEGDPWQAAVISANLGGDTDTIGAIATGMAGACVGYSKLPQDHSPA